MTEFDQHLRTVFGPRVTEFSPALRERLFELWAAAFELGSEMGHACGEFDPSSQGPVGPEGCNVCQMLTRPP